MLLYFSHLILLNVSHTFTTGIQCRKVTSAISGNNCARSISQLSVSLEIYLEKKKTTLNLHVYYLLGALGGLDGWFGD